MSDPRGKRYTMPVIARARQLGKAGWSYSKVRDLLGQEFGVRPSLDTIGCWLSEDYATTRRRVQAAARRRYREKLGWSFRLPGSGPEYRSAFVRLLDEKGLAVRDIGSVCDVVFGDDFSDDDLWMAIDGVALTATET